MNRAEVVSKVKKMVDDKFGGDWTAAFRMYATGTKNLVNEDGLWDMLKDAGVGNVFTRSMIVDRILSVVDRDGDGAVSWEEFSFVLKPSIQE